MNACLNLVKALLALVVKKTLDWPLKFLTLEVFTFSVWIHFLDLVIFDFFDFYDFFVLAFFHLDPPPKLPNHLFGFLSFASTKATGPAAEVVFSIKASRAASLLNP